MLWKFKLFGTSVGLFVHHMQTDSDRMRALDRPKLTASGFSNITGHGIKRRVPLRWLLLPTLSSWSVWGPALLYLTAGLWPVLKFKICVSACTQGMLGLSFVTIWQHGFNRNSVISDVCG